MKTMADNHDLYFKTEVLLLADVFEGFRSFCLANYELYPCLVFHRSWIGFRCSIQRVVTEYRHAAVGRKRNSWRNLSDPFMHEAYDPSNPTKYIIYLDANNLYGWAMCQPLPNGGFKWMQPRCLAEGLTDFDDWQDFLVSLKLILSIRKSHTLFTTIIPFPLRG